MNEPIDLPGMTLAQFIERTLVGIVEGSAAAQSKLRELGALVNPHRWPSDHNDAGANWVNVKSGRVPVQSVKFDVALTVDASREREQNQGADLSIKVAGAKVGQTDTTSGRNESIHRVQFEIRLAMPASMHGSTPT